MNKAERTEWAQAELNAEGEIVELRARIRELEAELDTALAERNAARLSERLGNTNLRARVAELERIQANMTWNEEAREWEEC